jgi:hypothetical protein
VKHKKQVIDWQLRFAAASVVDTVAEQIKWAKKHAGDDDWERARIWLRDQILDTVVFVLWTAGPLFGEIVEQITPEKVEAAMDIRLESGHTRLDKKAIQGLGSPQKAAQRILGKLLHIEDRQIRTLRGKIDPESALLNPKTQIPDDDDIGLALKYATERLLKKPRRR